MEALKEARRILFDIILADDPRQLILATACLSLAIGVFLLQPFPVFADVQAYRFMRYLPENTWAVIFITVGGSKIIVCLMHEPLMRSCWRYLPVVLNGLTVVLWTFVWAGVYASNPETLGTIVYFALLLAPTWATIRRFGQARDAGRR